MATYKEIKGVTIQTLDSDPVIGGAPGGSWASGGSLNTGRVEHRGGGNQTSALMFGGYSTAETNVTEEYNGSAYTEVNDLNTARSLLGGAGANAEACLAFGGQVSGGGLPQATEVWNGSSWTEVNEMNTGREGIADNGISTAALASGGKNPGSSSLDVVESWNGTSWTEVSEINTGRRLFGGVGTYTDAVVFSGLGPSTATEIWNGSGWTEVAEVNTSRYNFQGFGDSSSSAFFTGGYTGSANSAANEFWNGTSWTEVADLADSGNAYGSAGSSSAGLVSGGNGRSPNAVTEEWTTAPVTAAILNEGMIFLSGGTTLKAFGKAAGIPSGSFSSGGNLNTSRGYMAGCGSQTAGSVFGGSPYNSPPKAELHEQYDGSSWTETTDSSTGHSAGSASTKGTQTAVIIFSGGPPPTGTYTESWNGSAWTEVNNLNTSRNNGPAGFGVQTSAICCGGNNPPLTTTESWDGTSWTAVNSMGTGRRNFAGCGPSSAGIVAGGQGPTANAETWDGTSWTEVNNLNAARRGVTLFGDGSSSAFCTGGGSSAANEFWNGTSWTEVADLSTGRNDSGAGGSSVAGFVAGGPQSGGSATEEWTADAALSTVTVS